MNCLLFKPPSSKLQDCISITNTSSCTTSMCISHGYDVICQTANRASPEDRIKKISRARCALDHGERLLQFIRVRFHHRKHHALYSPYISYTVIRNMSSSSMGASKQVVRPPQRGIFPLDHYSECRPKMESYLACLKESKDTHH